VSISCLLHVGAREKRDTVDVIGIRRETGCSWDRRVETERYLERKFHDMSGGKGRNYAR